MQLPPEIVREILKHLSTSNDDLRSCSLVCRTWRDEARPFIKKPRATKGITKPYKLIVFGHKGVGKSAMVNQLCGDSSSVIFDQDWFSKQIVIDDEPCTLEILDCQGKYKVLLDMCIRKGEGFLLVYSIASRSTFERIERFYNQIFRIKGTVPLMLVGNQCDKVNEREVSPEEGHAMALRFGCGFIETSVETCVNVERSFYLVASQIRMQRKQKCARANREQQKRCNIQ
ncbi:P-loop containing nucleoside triphosphate hydrolase protein [Endogone sp. FLAS-F59071]|nr:P-loop containing nucleoside triphosphate hydrolase protein [Endogone sp. FLAS-F59071]|eukprot:RUS21221.1 P-loop containing nucleoside triphosphate hydrolase protein [Endogone sp. FLAS-F59071]